MRNQASHQRPRHIRRDYMTETLRHEYNATRDWQEIMYVIINISPFMPELSFLISHYRLLFGVCLCLLVWYVMPDDSRMIIRREI